MINQLCNNCYQLIFKENQKEGKGNDQNVISKRNKHPTGWKINEKMYSCFILHVPTFGFTCRKQCNYRGKFSKCSLPWSNSTSETTKSFPQKCLVSRMYIIYINIMFSFSFSFSFIREIIYYFPFFDIL